MTSASTKYSEIFFKAVRENDIQTLKSLLDDKSPDKKNNFDVNELTKKKSTALHLTIANKNADMVRLLLEYDAKIDLKNEDGENCLEVAAKLGQHDLVNLCLQSIGWIYGLTYPIKCKIPPLKQNLAKPMPYDSDYNVYDIFEFLLSNKADPNIQSPFSKNTPLHSIMTEKGPADKKIELQISLIKLLLEYGADSNILNNEEHSPFHLSFQYNNVNLVNYFIDRGANLYHPDYKKNVVYLVVTHGMQEIFLKLMRSQVHNNNWIRYVRKASLHLCFIKPVSYNNPKNCIATMRLLIEQGSDVNKLNVANHVPLYCAARNGCFEAVKFLVEMGADVNGHHAVERPLFGAVEAYHFEMVKFLISCGARMDFYTRFNRSLLNCTTYLLRRLRTSHSLHLNSKLKNIIKYFLEKGMSVSERDKVGLSDWQVDILNSYQEEVSNMKKIKIHLEILNKAIREGDIVKVEELMSDEGFDINATIKSKSTALHVAIASKSIDVVRLLLECDAKIDLKNEDGENCLEVAAKLGEHDSVNLCLQRIGWIYGLTYPIECKIPSLKQNLVKPMPYDLDYNVYDIFEFLLSNKADPNIQSPFSKNTPLHSIMTEKGPATKKKELQTSLIKLLLEYGADSNVLNNDGYSPFHLCFMYKNANLVDCFLKHGANIDHSDYKKSALYLSVVHAMHEIVKKLIKANVNVNTPLIDGDRLKTTLLHECFTNFTCYKDTKNCLATVKLLIERGADVNALSSNCITPLFLAAKSGSLEGVKYLVEMGADVNKHKSKPPLCAAILVCNLEITEFLISLGASTDVSYSINGQIRDVSLLEYSARFLGSYRADVDARLCNIIKLLLEKGERFSFENVKNIQRWKYILLMSFQKEITSMKKIRVCQNCDVTYFDLLTQRRDALVRSLSFKDVKIAMESGDYKQLFIHFADRLEMNYISGLKRMSASNQL